MILLKWPTNFLDWYSPILHFFVMLALHCPNLWKKQVSMVHERICSLKCMLALGHGCNYIFIDTVSGFLGVGDGFTVFISFFCIYSGKVYKCIHFYVLPLNDPIKTILSSFWIAFLISRLLHDIFQSNYCVMQCIHFIL